MAYNYGIEYAKKCIKTLEDVENKMMAETGFGWDKFSRENMALLEHKRRLEKWSRERELGLKPSYDPYEHGE